MIPALAKIIVNDSLLCLSMGVFSLLAIMTYDMFILRYECTVCVGVLLSRFPIFEHVIKIRLPSMDVFGSVWKLDTPKYHG